MRTLCYGFAASVLLAPHAYADTPSFTRQAYVGGQLEGLSASPARNGNFGLGWNLQGGYRLSPQFSAELALGGHGLKRRTDTHVDYLYHLGINALWNANNNPDGHGVFLLAGLGMAYEDLRGFENLYPQANVGFGVLLPSPWPQLKLRSDVTHAITFGKTESGTNHAFGDNRLGLGVQWNWQTPAPSAPAPLGDEDGDGVANPSDQCPGTPPGQAVNAQGCPEATLDADHDGVADGLDQCPDTPQGTAVDTLGCPVVVTGAVSDSDGDGIADPADHCPDTPKPFAVNSQGCVLPQKQVMPTLQFESNSAELTAPAKQQLAALAADLAQQTLRVSITGHTDALGPAGFNLGLSQRRAAAVAQFLTAAGLAPARLSSQGAGEFEPLSSNDTEQGRSRNRRVELELTLP